MRLPFGPGTKFTISQGAFGQSSHNEPGNEYSWDFDVPLGTPVRAVQDGRVIEVWEPKKGGSCNPKFSDWASNIKVEHSDKTVAQYVHVDSRVRTGNRVRAGQLVAVTANDGWLCTPQLHFGIYASRSELYGSPRRRTIPLAFKGLPDGLASTGLKYKVPFPTISSEKLFDRRAWLNDFSELKKFMASTYVNLDWMIESKRVDIQKLVSNTEAALQGADSDGEALAALKDFAAAFDDPHFKLVSQDGADGESGAKVLHSQMTGEEACSALGFENKLKDFLFPVGSSAGFEVLRSRNESFRYGTMDIDSDHSVGVVRISSFLETHYLPLCVRAWNQFRKKLSGPCDSSCQERFVIENVENGLLAEFNEVLTILKKKKISGLLLDVTGNGGGTDWEAGIARMITPMPLVCGARGFIRHPHHIKRLSSFKEEVLKELANPKLVGQKSMLRSKLVEIEGDLAEAAKQCDRSSIWTDTQVALKCPLVVKRLVSDCSPDPAYQYPVGVYQGPVFLLANHRSSSATEDLLARHKDSNTALLIGERTNGAGCGYINGGVSLLLPHSKLKVRVPDCVRSLANGENEVGGIDPHIQMDMRGLATDGFLPSLKATLADAFDHRNQRKLSFNVAVQSGGLPTESWMAAIKDRVEPEVWKTVASNRRPLSRSEQEWLEKIKVEAHEWWKTDVLRLNQPFLPDVKPALGIEIVFGNQGGTDGFTGSGPFIYLDLSSWVKSYGSPEAVDASSRIQRILSHEYTHLLTKSLAALKGWSRTTPFDRVLWEMYHEGFSYFHSVSAKWVTPKGEPTDHARDALKRLAPILVERLTKIKDAGVDTDVEALTRGLSAGPFNQKWGALPIALWLHQEAQGNYGTLRTWADRGPQGIIDLMQIYLPEQLSDRLKR